MEDSHTEAASGDNKRELYEPTTPGVYGGQFSAAAPVS